MNEKHYLAITVGSITFLGVMLFAIFGDKGYVQLAKKRATLNRIHTENLMLKEHNLELRRLIKRLRHDDHYIEWIARTELNMVRRDEIVLVKPRVVQ